MTICEFFVESVTADVRLEVARPGLSVSVALLNRLDVLIGNGAGRRLGANFGELAADMTVDDVLHFLKGVDRVQVGRPAKPDPGPVRVTRTALAAVSPDSLFTAVFFAAEAELVERKGTHEAHLDAVLEEPTKRLTDWVDESARIAATLDEGRRRDRHKQHREVKADTERLIASMRTTGQPLFRVLAVLTRRKQ